MSIYRELREAKIAEDRDRLFEDVMVRVDNHVIGSLGQKRAIAERAINIAYRQGLKPEDVPVEMFYQGHFIMDEVKRIARDELRLTYRENEVRHVRAMTIGDLVNRE